MAFRNGLNVVADTLITVGRVDGFICTFVDVFWFNEGISVVVRLDGRAVDVAFVTRTIVALVVVVLLGADDDDGGNVVTS